jgi:hypothetical protein
MARNWNILSKGYKGRLERSGISRQAYESGASLKKARGHINTPEHPKDAEKNPAKYSDYVAKRDTLNREVAAKKRALFGQIKAKNGKGGFNRKRSDKNTTVNPTTEQSPSIRNMQRFLDLGEDLFDEPDFDWDDDEWAFLYYH